MNTERTPSVLLTFDTDLITITDKKRQDKRTTLTQDEIDFYSAAWIRHEPERNMLYVRARALDGLRIYDPTWNTLFNSGQYLGPTHYAFYGFTPYKAPNCKVYVFDLSKPHEERTVIPDYIAKKQYKVYAKKFRKDPKELALAMDRWRARYINKLKRDGRVVLVAKTETEVQVAKLQEQIRVLNARILGRKPNKRKPKPTETLPELDAYIAENKPHIRRKITRRVVEDGVPRLETKTYDPAEHGLATIGLYTDMTDLTGKREVALALQVAALKQSVPNFKDDRRRRISQTFRIHSNTAQGSVYCAIFDLS